MDFQLEYTVEVPATIDYKVRAFSRESAMHIVLSTCPTDLESEECITQEGYDNMSVDGHKLPKEEDNTFTVVQTITERELMIEFFREFLYASLSKDGAKEGILRCCYKDDMIPQCHPDEPSDKELIEMICDDAREMNPANMYELRSHESGTKYICDKSDDDEKYDYPYDDICTNGITKWDESGRPIETIYNKKE